MYGYVCISYHIHTCTRVSLDSAVFRQRHPARHTYSWLVQSLHDQTQAYRNCLTCRPWLDAALGPVDWTRCLRWTLQAVVEKALHWRHDKWVSTWQTLSNVYFSGVGGKLRLSRSSVFTVGLHPNQYTKKNVQSKSIHGVETGIPHNLDSLETLSRSSWVVCRGLLG